MNTKTENSPNAIKMTAAFLVCNIIQKGIAFLTIPVFARMLSTEQMGLVTVYLSWMEILTVFLTLQLPYGSFSKAMVKFENRRDEYTSAVEGICVILSGVFLILLIPFGKAISNFARIPVYLFVLMTAEILASAGLLFWSGKQRFEYKYIAVVIVTLIVSLLSPLFQLFLIQSAGDKGLAKIVGNSVIVISFGGTIFLLNIIKGKRLFSKEFWKYAFSFNIPLLPYYLSQIVFNTSDRIIIDDLCGKDKAGIYGVVYNISYVLVFVINSFNNAYTPWFFQRLKSKNIAKNRELSIYVAVILLVPILLLILFAPELVGLIGGANYVESVLVVPSVSLSILLLFYTQVFVNYEFYYEKKKLLVLSSILAAVINIILNYACIPVWGYVVAGYTTFFSYFILMLINYIAARLLTKDVPSKESGFDMKWFMLVLFCAIAFSFAFVMLYDWLIVRIIICAITIVLAVILRKTIVNMVNAIREIMSFSE